MTIGTTIAVDTGTLTVTAVPSRTSKLYTLSYSSCIGKEYDVVVQMDEEQLKRLIKLKR